MAQRTVPRVWVREREAIRTQFSYKMVRKYFIVVSYEQCVGVELHEAFYMNMFVRKHVQTCARFFFNFNVLK